MIIKYEHSHLHGPNTKGVGAESRCDGGSGGGSGWCPGGSSGDEGHPNGEFVLGDVPSPEIR